MQYSIPMTPLFRSCAKVLDAEKRPLHYADLTKKAVKKMGFDIEDVDMMRVKEDVREKMLLKNQYGTFYTKNPTCLAAKKRWFKPIQQDLFQDDRIFIPGSATSGANGAYNALMRPMQKKNENASMSAVYRAKANGLVLEQHVSDWFKKIWPEYWMPADNYDNHLMWCDHDFKLYVNGKIFKVDVFGPNKTGEYIFGDKKRKIDLHLACRIEGDYVVWEGVHKGMSALSSNKKIEALKANSPDQMVVWLNCHKYGFNYGELMADANA